jgi:Sulfotransferase domain
LPISRFLRVLGVVRGAKAQDPKAQDPKAQNAIAQNAIAQRAKAQKREAQHAKASLRKRLRDKRQEFKQTRKAAQPLAWEWTEKVEWKKGKKTLQQEIFQLEKELRAAKEERGKNEGPQTGALPDFLVIGIKKGGTSFLYHLLSQHPCVEPAASKELHFFDYLFEEGVEWYRRCFPVPRRKDGRRTITGEATPYLDWRGAPEKVAGVVPQVRLIALLRDPVDRAYSEYQMVARKGHETRTFEEVVEAERKAWPRAEVGHAAEREDHGGLVHADSGYLYRSVYVDHLLRWSTFFSREQMLVLKSEDLFERPRETLKLVLDFLDLPDWEPEASQLVGRRNKGEYEQEMNPSTRRRLEEYFEPHNRRLYDFLGRDLGW